MIDISYVTAEHHAECKADYHCENKIDEIGVHTFLLYQNIIAGGPVRDEK